MIFNIQSGICLSIGAASRSIIAMASLSEKVEEKMGALDATLQSVLSAINKLQKAPIRDESPPILHPSSSHHPNLVTNPKLEHNQKDSSLGYLSIENHRDYRDKPVRKVDMPVF